MFSRLQSLLTTVVIFFVADNSRPGHVVDGRDRHVHQQNCKGHAVCVTAPFTNGINQKTDTESIEKTTFVAVGGNGSWDQNGYSAGDDNYPILLDLRPISDLLNPMNFPGQPDIYVTVRKNLEAATRRYLASFISDPEQAIQSVSWLPEVKPEPIEVWRVYVRKIWCAGAHVSAKYALASKLEIVGYTGTAADRRNFDSTIKTDGLKTQKCKLKNTRTSIDYGRNSPGLIELRGTRAELAAMVVELNMNWHYNKTSNKTRSDQKIYAGKLAKSVPVGTRIDHIWKVKGVALPTYQLLVRFKRVK